MIRMLAVLAVGLVLEALGVVLISRGQKELQAVFRPEWQSILKLAAEAVLNRNLQLGVALEAGFFGCLLYLLSRADVSFVWPLTSLSLVVTTLTARWLLAEQVSPLRWAGIACIVCGAAVVIYTEKVQRKPGPVRGGTEAPAREPAPR